MKRATNSSEHSVKVKPANFSRRVGRSKQVEIKSAQTLLREAQHKAKAEGTKMPTQKLIPFGEKVDCGDNVAPNPLLQQLREALAEGREAELTASTLIHSTEKWAGFCQGLRVAIMMVEKQK